MFFKPVVINACLHYSFGRLVHRNWGDDINVFLLKKIFQRHISPLFFSCIALRKHLPNYLCIGSAITLQCTKDTIIWGGGVIDSSAPLPAIPKKVLAVRGPLTRSYLLERGIECPAVYGDPAMLITKIYQPRVTKKYKLGIIPHYDDYDSHLLDKFRQDPEILFIRMEGYENWFDIPNQICSCEMIASSSLHGLIVAESYGISNIWIEITGRLLGGHFKFHDFFLSIGVDRANPYIITPSTTKKEILAQNNNYIKGYIDLKPLIEACPFRTCIM